MHAAGQQLSLPVTHPPNSPHPAGGAAAGHRAAAVAAATAATSSRVAGSTPLACLGRPGAVRHSQDKQLDRSAMKGGGGRPCRHLGNAKTVTWYAWCCTR
jgi:hypothetical protein